MSWYVDYYIGYRNKEGKIFPLGPFDCFGNLRPILTKSRSFASDLWRRFDRVSLNDATEELKKHFPKGEDFFGRDNNAEELPPWCFWLCVDELPTGSYVKKGYFLQSDIAEYERSIESGDYFDGFYHMLTSSEYARKMEAELKFGIPKQRKGEDACEEIVYSCGDYSFYMYPDYESEEYEAYKIREVISMFEYCGDLPEGSEIIVLQTNG